jgi:hypothetical protein
MSVVAAPPVNAIGPQPSAFRVRLGDDPEEIRNQFPDVPRKWTPGQSYYSFGKHRKGVSYLDDRGRIMKGKLRVYNPHYDTFMEESIFPGDPENPVHGEIAYCYGIVRDRYGHALAALRYIGTEETGEIARDELFHDAPMFAEVLDSCLVQLSTDERMFYTEQDDTLIHEYMQTEVPKLKHSEEEEESD